MAGPSMSNDVETIRTATRFDRQLPHLWPTRERGVLACE
jgi:hypothetical protein